LACSFTFSLTPPPPLPPPLTESNLTYGDLVGSKDSHNPKPGESLSGLWLWIDCRGVLSVERYAPLAVNPPSGDARSLRFPIARKKQRLTVR